MPSRCNTNWQSARRTLRDSTRFMSRFREAHEIWLAEYQISGYVIGALSEFFGFGNAAIVCFILYGFVSICGFLATN
jgi:hypothetical protein